MKETIQGVVDQLFGVGVEVVLDRPEPKFGDYATSVAMKLAGPLGRNPREIAEEIAGALRETGQFSNVDIAGPGFINLRISDTKLLEIAKRPPTLTREGQEAVAETNNPNPFKAMHIGHAFNSILGDTVANLVEASGAKVHRVSYHGDVGTHVGKSMYAALNFLEGDISRLDRVPVEERNQFMSRLYVEGAADYTNNPEAKKRIEELSRLSFTREDEFFNQVYDRLLGWSFDEIDANVARLGNRPTVGRYLESTADVVGVDIVRNHTPGVFEISDGAYIFRGSKYGSFDNAFIASNGQGLYAARDMGLMKLKQQDYPNASKSYIVTAEEQKDYFKGVIAAANLCQPELAEKTVNISTGTVKLTTGKMSSREGDVVTISWLFDQVRQALIDRDDEPTDDVIAGALRYQFLKVRIGGDVIFDINEAISISGNSGTYLQYAHARATQIIEKSRAEASETDSYDENERGLLRKLSEYNEVVERASFEIMPHHICIYLYELAQEFNRFYEKSRIIGDDREAIRLGLVKLYRDTLAQGLHILGIASPGRL